MKSYKWLIGVVIIAVIIASIALVTNLKTPSKKENVEKENINAMANNEEAEEPKEEEAKDTDTSDEKEVIKKEETTEEKVLAYLQQKLLPHFEAHYEVLGDGLSYYKETILEDGSIEALIMYTVKYKNHDKDPDTVGYIKEAKEKNDPYYQTYYDEYLKPQEANYAEMKVVISPDGEMTLYQDMDPHSGEKWEVFE
ncbi:MAG: hypothetical protein ACRCWY_01750 [Cellulosilyticaceae bacterium]